MSNNFAKQVSQRKQVKSALERIDTLEQQIPQIIMGVNNALNSVNNQAGQLAAVVEAVVELFGSDTVDAKIKEISDRKALKSLEEAQAALKAGLETGKVVPAEKIGEQSLVVGRELEPNGEVKFPGKVQLTYASVHPSFKDALKGQGAGFSLDTPNGKFEVLEVYDVVEKAAEPAAQAAPEAPAPTPAPAETPAELDAALAPKAEA